MENLKKSHPDWKRVPPRYQGKWTAKAFQNNRVWDVTVANISKGGLLLTLPKHAHFLEDFPTLIRVQLQDTALEIHGQMVHAKFTEKVQLFGFQFFAVEPEVQEALESWLKSLEESNTARYPKRPNWFQALLDRLQDAMKMLRTKNPPGSETNAPSDTTLE